MSTVITVANNTGFTSIINPFLPITHLFKNQNILWFLAAKQAKTFTKQISRNITNKQKYQNNTFFHSSPDTLPVSQFKKQLVSQMFWK